MPLTLQGLQLNKSIAIFRLRLLLLNIKLSLWRHIRRIQLSIKTGIVQLRPPTDISLIIVWNRLIDYAIVQVVAGVLRSYQLHVRRRQLDGILVRVLQQVHLLRPRHLHRLRQKGRIQIGLILQFWSGIMQPCFIWRYHFLMRHLRSLHIQISFLDFEIFNNDGSLSFSGKHSSWRRFFIVLKFLLVLYIQLLVRGLDGIWIWHLVFNL